MVARRGCHISARARARTHTHLLPLHSDACLQVILDIVAGLIFGHSDCCKIRTCIPWIRVFEKLVGVRHKRVRYRSFADSVLAAVTVGKRGNTCQ